MTYNPAAGLQRRRDAALRTPPLPSGHRDPDGPQTDAPDLDGTDWQEVVELQRSGAAARQAQWANTSAIVDEDRISRVYERARYLSQTRGLPWSECARIARDEDAADPGDPDPHDTFGRLFPDPVTDEEKARARRAAHNAATALGHAQNSEVA